MFRLVTPAALLIALMGLVVGLQPAAAASKVVALVIGNEAPDNGLDGSELNAKLKDLKDNLFRYGHESMILEGQTCPTKVSSRGSAPSRAAYPTRRSPSFTTWDWAPKVWTAIVIWFPRGGTAAAPPT